VNYKFTIKGTLPGLNELIEAERRHRQEGARLKKQCETVVMNAARQMGGAEIQEPVYMVYHWYEKDRRRDKDNICAFGRKVIQDALVKARYLCNDGWKNIRGFEDHFEVDAKNPRVVVEIWERDETDENGI
jgi:Holliday junction resolvase RusA-like endonuclease